MKNKLFIISLLLCFINSEKDGGEHTLRQYYAQVDTRHHQPYDVDDHFVLARLRRKIHFITFAA